MSAGPAGAKEAERAAGSDVLRDERLAWLVLQLEAPIAALGARNASLTDGQALAALEHARDRIDKGTGILIVPGESRKPRNELGEAVFEASERARWESAVVLTTGLEGYGREEKLRCLDRVLATVRFLARGRPDGRAYVADLVGRFERLREAGRKPGRLVSG